MNCSKCDKKIGYKTFPNGLCQGCYKYFKSGGTENPIPPPGRIELDKRGYVICHICGRAYERLGSHVRESHSMTIRDYKEKFGLCNSAKLTGQRYHNYMRKVAYDKGMAERLLVSGIHTRFVKGESRTRNIRLQEKINFAERMKKYREEKNRNGTA